MITDPQKIVELIVEGVKGTSQDIMMYVDYLIEDGEISEESFKQEEKAILYGVDNEVFQCDGCGWTLDISDLEDDNYLCSQCYEEQEDE